MGDLDEIFYDEIQEVTSFKKVGTKLIARKLAQHGIDLSEEQLEQLELRLGGINLEDEVLDIEIDDLIPDGYNREDILIDLDDSEELDQLLDEILEKVTSSIPNIVTEISCDLLEELKADAPQMLEAYRQERAKFETRLSQKWGKALNLLDMLIAIALEAGEEFNQEYRDQAVKDHDLVFEALTRLHARACQVAQEVLVLLRSGFADGAHARWRTLHEITVVAWFVKEKGNDVANRYLLHEHIESYKAALQHQKYYARLGQRPISTQAIARLKTTHDQLITQFGPTYKKNYGWASAALAHPDPKFDDIEQAVAFDHWRPYYKLASHNVHANPKGAMYRLGLPPNSPPSLLAGPSDAGLSDPGHGTLISLAQITTALLTTHVNIDRLVVCKVMQKLVRESSTTFMAVHKEMGRPKHILGRRRTNHWKPKP
ncbi:MAG TPA: DUF5677 domain-containing protein [Herpetosiphonaceae bacterium]